MTKFIYANSAVTISELQGNTAAMLKEANNAPIAILDCDRVAAYLISAEAFEVMMEKLEDIDLAELVRKRWHGKTVKVSLDEL